MREPTRPPPAQLRLDLRRDPTVAPVAPNQAELMQALADLLLGALGGQNVGQSEDLDEATTMEGGAHELEDHI